MADKPTRLKVVTPVFRVSFPAVFETAKPMAGDDGVGKKPKYEVTMVFDPSRFDDGEKKRFKEMEALLDHVAMEKFKKTVAKFPANFKKAFHDGAEKEHLAGFGAGLVYAKASSFAKPGVVAADRVTPIEDREAFYPGCYARASVTAYAYDNVSKGVAFGLSNLMFVKDGERLDSRTDPTEDFGEAPLGDSADDLA